MKYEDWNQLQRTWRLAENAGVGWSVHAQEEDPNLWIGCIHSHVPEENFTVPTPCVFGVMVHLLNAHLEKLGAVAGYSA